MPTADLPAGFWAGWIAVLTVASLIGLGWLVYSVYFGGNGSSAASAEGSDEGEDEPRWDGNLREGAHPAPMWWFWLLFGSLAISVLYLMLYPGLGSYAGALQWSQGGRLNASMAAFEARFGPRRQAIAQAPLAELRADPDLMASAWGLFQRNCAACHGQDAQGQAQRFPDLTDGEWQWGGSAADIEQSIRQGRQAVMVGWLAPLGEEGVRQVADYTLQLLQGPPPDGHPGRVPYLQFCAACHGPQGAGNPLLGAPSLVDQISLYGNDAQAIEQSIALGRSGLMPAFVGRLDDAQIRLLTALLAPDP